MGTNGLISLHSLDSVRESAEQSAAIEAITAENYANPEVLLAQEYHKNDRVYLYHDEENVIRGFFMVGWSRLVCGAKETDSVFLGLSSITNSHKGRGAGGLLYRAFFRDALEREAMSGFVVRWWAHTATPAVPRACWQFIPDIAPMPDGTYSPENLAYVGCLQERYGLSPYVCSQHPFVLRAYAKARYSTLEQQRIRESGLKGKGFDLLAGLGVDESKGDRLMLVGRVPGSILAG
jgi:hypothetical protein